MGSSLSSLAWIGAFKAHDIGLTSLEGCPREVGGEFDCLGNQLTTLEGAPRRLVVLSTALKISLLFLRVLLRR